jgi:hypothetical protein
MLHVKSKLAVYTILSNAYALLLFQLEDAYTVELLNLATCNTKQPRIVDSVL